MKKLFLVVTMILLIPQMVWAYSFEVDGNKIDISGEQINVSDGEKDVNVKLNEDNVVISGEEGVVEVNENSVKTEDNQGNVIEIDNEKIAISNDDIESIILGELPVVVESEEPDLTTGYKEVKDNSIVFDDNGSEVKVNIGAKGVKVSDKLGSVIVYYADSGIETSEIKIGDKSGAIYLSTDFGEVKIGVLPLKIVREMVNQDTRVERSEFKWSADAEVLNYAISGQKRQRILWIIPVEIAVVNLYNVENGQLMGINKSGWHTFLDAIAF